jgi:CubicO group peptidase (beta-lactamase class C family)
MTKVITAVAALQLFEAGKLSLDAPVTNWLSELKDLRVFAGGTADEPRLTALTNALTVKMLLNHTGGFTYDFFSGSPVEEIYKKVDLWNSASLNDFIAKVARLPLVAQPGSGISETVLGDTRAIIANTSANMPRPIFVNRVFFL